MYGLFKSSTHSSSRFACRMALSVYPEVKRTAMSGSLCWAFRASSELWSLPGIGPHHGSVKGGVAVADNYTKRARPPSLAPGNVEANAVPCGDELGEALWTTAQQVSGRWSLFAASGGCRYAADKGS